MATVNAEIEFQDNNDAFFTTNAAVIYDAGIQIFHVDGRYKFGDGVTALSALPFRGASSGGSWGSITGTLSAQTDLQNALNNKEPLKGADDNYVTDAEKTVIQNTSGTNTGDQDLSGLQATSAKDATGGYVGLTLFKINFKNALNTFTSFFTNSNTAARTYTFPDKDGTVAMTSDINRKVIFFDGVDSAGTGGGTTNVLQTTVLIPANTFASGDNMRIFLRTNKSNSLGTVTVRAYFNTTNTFGSATLLSTFAGAAGHIFVSTVKNFIFKPGNVLRNSSATFSLASDEGAGGISLAIVNFTLNPTSDFYLFFALQNANGTENSVFEQITIEKIS